MSHLWRKILFTVFALGFLITAPLLVFYTAGYRYEFGSSRIVKAGVLSAASIPKGATVILDNVSSDKKTPAVIDNVLPGQVKIKLEKTGYSSWEKTLPVVSGESTFIPNAILFLDGSPTQAVDQTSIIAVAIQNSSRIAFLTNNRGTLEVWLKEDTSSQNRLLFKQPLRAKSTYSATWSQDGSYLLLKESTSKNLYTLIRVSDQAVIELPIKSTSDIWFDVGSTHTLVYRTGTELRAFGIDADIAVPKKVIADDLQFRDGKILAIQSNNQSVLSYLDANGIASIIAYLPLGQYRFLHAPSPYLFLEDALRRHIILLDPNKKNPLLLNEEILFSEWSPKEDRLLFSNGFDIKIYALATDQTETITRFSEPLTDLVWYPLGDEILYGRESVLNALELDRRDERNETKLVDGYITKKMWVKSDGSSLFFFGQKGTDPAMIFERVVQK